MDCAYLMRRRRCPVGSRTDLRPVPCAEQPVLDALLFSLAIDRTSHFLFGMTPYFNDATVINFVSRISLLFTTLFG